MARPATPAQTRFWAAVEKHDGCWRWAGVIMANGYGRFFRCREGGKVKYVPAHRYSWELHYGPVPAGMQVCHRCDNPCCVNPAHLFLGTHADSMADRNQKGRQARATSHGNSRLDPLKVLWIRDQKRRGRGAKSMAKELGVNKSTVQRVLQGRTWTSVKEA